MQEYRFILIRLSKGQGYYQNKKGPTPLLEAAAENCPTFGNALTPTHYPDRYPMGIIGKKGCQALQKCKPL